MHFEEQHVFKSFSHHNIASSQQANPISASLKTALFLNPAFGRARMNLGGLAMTTQSYLDAIYYYLSALDAEDPVNCRETLDMAFSRCIHHEHYLISYKRRNGGLTPKDTLRLLGCQYLMILGKIWTKVDLDQLDSLVKLFDHSFRLIFEKTVEGEVCISSEILVHMIVCLLMCVSLCEQEDDSTHHWKQFCEKDENERPPMFVITSRDLCML
jgi:hypothetical protein